MNKEQAIYLSPIPVALAAGATGFFVSSGTKRERFLTGVASLLGTYVLSRAIASAVLVSSLPRAEASSR